MHEQETFASRLTRLIHEHGTSHAEIGRVVGVSGQAVGKWAKGGNIEYDNLQTLAMLTRNKKWQKLAEETISVFGATINANPPSAAWMLSVIQ